LEPEEFRIKLVASDGHWFMVSSEFAKMSPLVRSLIKNEDLTGEKQVVLPEVESLTLAKVLEFCAHYDEEPMKYIEAPLKNADLYQVVQEWYAKYITDLNNDNLFKLTLAANYLDVSQLIDLCGAKIASMMKDKTVEEIRQNFDIVNDFTPEEEARVREENKWLDELK